jgi:hypothetical protein
LTDSEVKRNVDMAAKRGGGEGRMTCKVAQEGNATMTVVVVVAAALDLSFSWSLVWLGRVFPQPPRAIAVRGGSWLRGT